MMLLLGHKIMLLAVIVGLVGCEQKPPDQADQANQKDVAILKEQMRDMIQAVKSNMESIDNQSRAIENQSRAIENLHHRVQEVASRR